ncbi:hypothetical protein C453_05564 [Haloferax elongans ATCC BAA-1513]|uniref:SHOCT domain-containing protein n=1 Tax=Haloferax elongans ATCC BAA-1513 TaxID=1230453 RepID=M0HPS7_HALEO|nr:SHOCT domain-containing protein [Haloferax elongans]ELZ86580.1 hypothetical protein C453_05564 [Haloferax elongans ATCC BAA-1513]
MSNRGRIVDSLDDDDSPLEELVAGVVIGLILLVGFGLLALDVSWFWVAFPIGFAGVLPAALALVKIYESRHEEDAEDPQQSETQDALETLRQRYAAGELTEAEFEAKVERLLETETVADARKRTASDTREETAIDATNEELDRN